VVVYARGWASFSARGAGGVVLRSGFGDAGGALVSAAGGGAWGIGLLDLGGGGRFGCGVSWAVGVF